MGVAFFGYCYWLYSSPVCSFRPFPLGNLQWGLLFAMKASQRTRWASTLPELPPKPNGQSR